MQAGRHARSGVEMYCGVMGAGANQTVLTFPQDVVRAGCANVGLVPDWSTLQALPWASGDAAAVSRVYCEMRAIGGAAAAGEGDDVATVPFARLNTTLPRGKTQRSGTKGANKAKRQGGVMVGVAAKSGRGGLTSKKSGGAKPKRSFTEDTGW